MTGLRQARQALKTMREELGADGGQPRLVSFEAGANVDKGALDAFLDRELGEERDRCLIIHLVRFCDATPPRIIADQAMGGR
jgi:hypothetical protein